MRDPQAVAELKSDLRLDRSDPTCGRAASAFEAHLVWARLEGSFVSVREREVREHLAAAREELGLTGAARERFRMSLLRAFYEAYGRMHGAAAIRNFDEVEQALRSRGYLDRVLKAAWPAVAPCTASSAGC